MNDLQRTLVNGPQLADPRAMLRGENAERIVTDSTSMEAPNRASSPRLVRSPERLHVTRALYHRMDELGLFEGLRVQLIEGEVIVMPPRPHAYPVQEMNTVLVKALPDSYRVRPQLPVALDDENEPEPDFAIVEVGSGEDGETRRVFCSRSKSPTRASPSTSPANRSSTHASAFPSTGCST